MNYREPQSLNRLTILGAQVTSLGLTAGSAVALATGAAATFTPFAIPIGVVACVNFLCANKAAHVHSIHKNEEKLLRQAEKAGVSPEEYYSEHLNQHKQLSPIITKAARFGALGAAGVGTLLCVIAAPALITGVLTASIAPAAVGLLYAGVPTLAAGALLMRTSEVADTARGYAYSSAAQKERDMTARRIDHEQGKHTASALSPEQAPATTYWQDKLAEDKAAHSVGKSR
jgi:uncharacterized RDD family membrane protein YckC